jgi:tetratricopeptide (TPR) repeat protein
VWTLASQVPAQASDASQRLIRDGIQKIQAKAFKAALEDFNRALAADPKDGRAAFYQGYVLNRLGQFGPAYAAFEDMRRRGVTHPEANYEEGWAAVATGRWQRAIALLEPYEKAHPNNGKASEFLGRAYLAVQRFADAEAAFDRAMARDPATKPNALYFLAQVKALQGDTAEAGASMNRLAREAPTSPIGVAVGNEVRREVARRADEKPWTVFLSTGLGHNDNVVALSGDILRPADITNTDSGFFELQAGGEYRFNILPTSTLTAGYALRYDNYFDISGQDVVDHNPYLTYRHALLRDVLGVLTFSGEYLEVGGSFYRSGYTVRPSIIAQTGIPSLAVEAFYSYSDFNYKEPAADAVPPASPAIFGRDSLVQSIGLRATYQIPEIATTLEAGIAQIWNSATGGDFDYRGPQVSIGGTSALPWWQLSASARVSYAHYSYDNLNSLAPTTPPGVVGFGFAREDEVATFSARLSRPIFGPATAFVQYDYTSQDSNISVYQYDQQQVMGGLLVRF